MALLIDALKQWYANLVPSQFRTLVRPLIRPRRAYVARHALRHCSGRVLSGPFAGMVFPNEEINLTKSLGTYELELHPVFERLRGRRFSHIYDIGAAEGYYAVGMALWNRDCPIVAFEMTPRFQEKTEALAAANGVAPRISIRGRCDLAELAELGDLPTSFIVMDIEGGEDELLDPSAIPSLREATILVEHHDHIVRGASARIVERFESSHVITKMWSRPRTTAEFPVDSWVRQSRFMASAVVHLISDGRTATNGWMLLEPKSRLDLGTA